MPENEIIGKGTQDQLAHAREFLIQERAIGKTPLHGESIKTSEEKQFVSSARQVLQGEFSNLNIPHDQQFTDEQFHIFHDDRFIDNFGPHAPDAVTDTMSSAVFLNRDRYPDRFAFYVALFHEGIHLASHQKFHLFEGSLPIATYRAGYTNMDFCKRPHREHFRGFDEAVVDMTTRELIEKNWQNLSSTLHFNENDKAYLGSLKTATDTGYGEYDKIIDFVIDGIAQNKGEAREAVWNRFKKGVFTGEMMHLRDVERVFGKGTLRVLAHLGTSKDGEPQKNDAAIVMRYLQSGDEEEKGQIAKELLSEVEYRAYLRRIGKLNQHSDQVEGDKATEKERIRPFRARFRFETHIIEDRTQYNATRQRLVNEMKQVFDPQQSNIYFAEDDSGAPDELDDMYHAGLELHGSHLRAYAYMSFVANNNYEPDQYELEVFVDYMYSSEMMQSLDPSLAPMYIYSLTIYEALDELTSQGYDIAFERERITNQEHVFQYRDQFDSLADFKGYYQSLTGNAKERDKLVASQLNEMARQAQENNKPVNVFVLRGRAHSGLTTLLPEELQSSISTSQTEHRPQREVNPTNEVLDMLMTGETVSDDLWNKAYGEHRKTRF